jgi:hypothetical protein
MQGFFQYFRNIKLDKMVLWCYLIWYFSVVYLYFDPAPKIWINSLGICAVIGTGLMLSVSSSKGSKRDHWQTFRLYLMPFCVSSFSALIKGHGFVVLFSPKIEENIIMMLCCAAFLCFVFIVKLISK